MTPEELAIAHQIMAKAEQRYFHLLGEAERSIGPTGGSWPGEVAASKMEPVMLEGLPGTLSLKYMLELRRDQILNATLGQLDIKGIEFPDQPNLEDVLWYHSPDEVIKIDLCLRKDLQMIYKIIIYPKTYTIEYVGENDKPTVIQRTLSPEAFEE